MHKYLWLPIIALAFMPRVLLAQREMVPPLSAGRVALPYNVSDNSGNQWIIYQQGRLGQGGNMPLFGQAATLNINGAQPSGGANQAILDSKTGEVIIDNLRAGNFAVSRRILVSRQEGWVRYVDVLKNTTQQEQPASIQLSSNYNFGVQSAQPVYDPGSKDRLIGAAMMIQTGRAVYEMYGGKGAKNTPQINPQPNNNMVQATMQVSVPAGKQIAIMHIHGTAATAEAGAQAMITFKENKSLSDLPVDLRKTIINLATLQSIGDREILRGDLLDVIELRDSDQLKGTVAETSYKLSTFYGPIELPADKVIGLISAGEFQPRELVITTDGEVFGGALDKNSIAIELSTGQKTNVPLAQISRVGYRKRSEEPDEWKFDKPMVALRSGERLQIGLPNTPVEVMTSLGLLKLPPQAIASIDFQPDDPGAHEICLTDGSRFSGFVTADAFQFQLAGAASQQNVTITAATIDRISFSYKIADVDDDDTPILRLTNHDQFVGTLSGQLQLGTRFDKIDLSAAALRSLTHSPQTPLDVQATLWDQSTLGGQLRESVIPCALTSGVTINVPVALLQSYSNPQAKPGDAVTQRIKEVVAQLSADDWKKREEAEAQLVGMGSNIVPVLKDLMASQPPEAKQRIESVLSQLDPKRANPNPIKPNPGE